MKYPQQIEATLLEIYDIRERLRDKRAHIRSLEISVTVTACQEKDERGKLVLSNETLRTAAINKTLEDDDDYRKQVTEVRDLERELATAEAALERLRMEWRLHLLELEDASNRAAMEMADKAFKLRHEMPKMYVNGVSDEVELPF